MNNQIIIGLHGVARVGKDEFANYISQYYGFTKLALADPIRTALFSLNPWILTDTMSYRLQDIINMFGWDEAKVLYPEIRRLMQVFGTEIARCQWNDNFWINLMIENIDKLNRVVISDVRFQNEVDMVRSYGNNGYLIKITRPGVTSVNSHISDAGLDDSLFDLVIRNDGSLKHFHNKIDKIQLFRSIKNIQ